MNADIEKYIPKNILDMHSYKVGESISKEYLKLNSNENPYTLPKKIIKKVIKDIKKIDFGLYPDESSTLVRKKAAEVFRLNPENVIVDNGSSSILSLIFRLFVHENTKAAFITPTFPYYYTLSNIQNADIVEFEWEKDLSLPMKKIKESDFDILFLPNPNAPTGHKVSNKSIEKLLKLGKIVVIDEAYSEFSGKSGIKLLDKYKNLIIVKSFSKSQSSASLRIGFCFTNPLIIENLDKIRVINNFNIINQKFAFYILDSYDNFRKSIKKIEKNRKFLSYELEKRNFEVIKSHANFILIKPLIENGNYWYKELKKNKILTRYFPKIEEFNLRITVGKKNEVKKLLKIVDKILKKRNVNDTF